MAEFQALVADTEKLLQSTADVAGDQAEKSRQDPRQPQARSRHLARHQDSLKDNVRERSQAAVDATGCARRRTPLAEHRHRRRRRLPAWPVGQPALSHERRKGPGGRPPLPAALRRRLPRPVARSRRAVRHRAAEQKANTLRLLLFAGLALVFALLLLVGLSLLVLIVFWDTNRLAAASGCACST